MTIVVVYVDDIIFGRDLRVLSVKFASERKKEFEMSILGELLFFLILQVSQKEKKGSSSLKPNISKTC